MFKKRPIIKSFSNLRNSERRKLVKATITDYTLPELSLSSKFLEQYLFPKVIEKAVFKTRTVTGTIYVDKNTGKPIWFETRDSKRLRPTLYTLWKSPYLLPIVHTPADVVKRLINGADLMIPGCIPPFDSELVEGALVSISAIESPKVIVAIGYCEVNLAGLTNVSTLSGRGVKIIHCYNDELFRIEQKLEPDPLPHDYDITLPVDKAKLLVLLQSQQSEDDDGSIEILNNNKREHEIDENKDEFGGDNKTKNLNHSDDDNGYQLSVEDVDEFFIRAVVSAIAQDKLELPMNISTFISAHVLENLPPVSSDIVNMKKTSWKKPLKFLQAMQSVKLLKLKGKGTNVMITEVAGKEHPKIANFEPYRTVKPKKNRTKNRENTVSPDSVINVFQLYSPRSCTREFFNKLDENFDQYYEAHDIHVLLDTYIRKFHLPLPSDRKIIRVDESLRNMGVKGERGNLVKRNCVYSMIMAHKANFQPYYKIENALLEENSITRTKGKLRKGFPPKINVGLELKIGRKVMTAISGLEPYDIEPQDLAAILKNKCSGSTTISKLDDSQAKVSVQGSHIQNVQEVLTKKYSIKESWINILGTRRIHNRMKR
ncbi:hypothetical protein HII12_005122 [Brettanomyces bruxellensis]|uniref:DEBR0S3_02718g1_1 n=1 Tax=Dekkera bruxellensis TaxID=5007 RepID=A0A7D9CYJ9_DEKBR|nr:hypothetical protein HII12_005122 [Brettanomyces bruxellensis]VUG18119.1 TMA64 [Brettanomyces bruxellensis]